MFRFGKGLTAFASRALCDFGIRAMTWVRQFALVVHLLGLALWLGGALAVTRASFAADNERDPAARQPLFALCKKLSRSLCEPWMFAAMGAGFLLVLLGPSRKTAALMGSRAFWIELASGVLLVLMQRALDRRVGRAAKVVVSPPERTPVEEDSGEAVERAESPSAPKAPYVPEHAPKLRRIQRVIFVLALLAVSAAVSRQ